MFKDFKQFVASSICLQCDGCCRFKEADSRWRPYITEQEKQIAATRLGVAEKIFGPNAVFPDGKIGTTPCAEGFLCHFLNDKENTCGIYHARPFECQLYPFLLGKENGQAVLYVHLNCPYVQEHFGTSVYKEYVEYLQGFFMEKNVREFLQKNPMLLTDYSLYRDELDCVCRLSLE